MYPCRTRRTVTSLPNLMPLLYSPANFGASVAFATRHEQGAVFLTSNPISSQAICVPIPHSDHVQRCISPSPSLPHNAYSNALLGFCIKFNNASQRIFGDTVRPIVLVWETNEREKPWSAEARREWLELRVYASH